MVMHSPVQIGSIPRAGFGCPGRLSATAELLARAEAALAATPRQRTQLIEHEGECFVVKRVKPRPRHMVQSWFWRWRVVLGAKTTSQEAQARSLPVAPNSAYEARRLTALAAAGVRVPRIVHIGSEYLLLEYCGTSIAMLVRGWSADTWRHELQRLAEQLAALHRSGQWHGAAQLKNLTRHGGNDYRIDFEENFGELLPLAMVQAIDVLLFLNSMSLREPIDEAEARSLLPMLLDCYLTANPDPRVQRALARLLAWADLPTGLLALAMRRRKSGRRRNGLARLVILVDVLAARLSPKPPDVKLATPAAPPSTTRPLRKA